MNTMVSSAWRSSLLQIIGADMQVHIFRGPGRVFGFTTQSSGENLPSQFAPWATFKSAEMRQGESMPGVDVDDCLRDLAAYGIHVTDAHARITEEAIRQSDASR